MCHEADGKTPKDIDLYFSRKSPKNAKIKTYRCKICDKGPFQSTETVYHMDAHRGTPKFRCDHCPAAFIVKKGLTKHNAARKIAGKCTQHKERTLPVKEFERYLAKESQAKSPSTSSALITIGSEIEHLISKYEEFYRNIKALASTGRRISSGVIRKRLNVIEFHQMNYVKQEEITYKNTFELVDDDTALQCKLCSRKLGLNNSGINRVMKRHFNCCTNFEKKFHCNVCSYATTTQELNKHKKRGHVEIGKDERIFSFDGKNQVRFGSLSDLNLTGRPPRPQQLYGLVMKKKGQKDMLSIEFTSSTSIAEAMDVLKESNSFRGPEIEGVASTGCSFKYYLMRGWQFSKSKSFPLNIKCYDRTTTSTIKFLCRRLTASTCVFKTYKSILRTIFCRDDIISKLTLVEYQFPKYYADFFQNAKLEKIIIPKLQKKMRKAKRKAALLQKSVKAELLIPHLHSIK